MSILDHNTGILNHGRVFGGKFITALILAGGGQVYPIAIRHMLTANLWLGEIEGHVYCFALPGAKGVYTLTSKAAVTARIVIYDIRHMMPWNDRYRELRDLLDSMHIRRAPAILPRVLRLLARQGEGGEEWEGHDLAKFLESQSFTKDTNPQWYNAVENWVKGLNVKEITMPISRISNMLDDDISLLNPSVFGNLAITSRMAGPEIDKLRNAQMNAKRPWFIMVAVIGLVIGIIAFVWYGVDNDLFGDLGMGGLGMPGVAPAASTDPCSANRLMVDYTEAMEIAVAIERGKLVCAELPPPFKDMVEAQDPELVKWAAQQEAEREALGAPPAAGGDEALDAMPVLPDLELPGVGGGMGIPAIPGLGP